MSDDTSFDFAEQMKAKRLGKNQESSSAVGEEEIEKTNENSFIEEMSNEQESENAEYVGGRATDLLKEERIRSTTPREYHPPAATDGVHSGFNSGSNDDWEEYSGKKGGVWGILKYPVVLPTLLCITGLLGFYLYTQTVSLIESLLAMPPILRIPLFGILVLLAALVICGLYDYWKTYVALRKNLQVVWLDLDATRTVRQDRESRTAINAAVDYLKKYIRHYPLPVKQEKSEFFEPEELKKMKDIRARLTDPNCPDTLTGWKNRFENEFQVHLEEAAWRRIETVARISAVKTAISPYPTMDMLIILFWSFTMLRDLCRIYHLRTGFVGTVYLLCCVFGNTFFAGKLDEMESEIGKTVTEQLSEHTSVFDFLPNAIEGTFKTLAGAFAGKASTALANYLLMKRLGYRAIQMLKPLR